MITNNKVTLLRYSQSADKYEIICACDAWVFFKRSISDSTTGDKNSDIYHIRVRKEDIERVKVGDLVYIGDIEGEEPNLAECREITAVSNNKFGTVPHWHIEVGA